MSLMGYPFDFSLSGSFVDGTDCLWVVRASVFVCLIRFRACACVRGSADRFVSTVGSRAFVFAYSIRSRACARTLTGQRTDLFSSFAVLYRARWIAGVHALRFTDIGQNNSSSCVRYQVHDCTWVLFLRANLIYCSPFRDLFLFLFLG